MLQITILGQQILSNRSFTHKKLRSTCLNLGWKKNPWLSLRLESSKVGLSILCRTLAQRYSTFRDRRERQTFTLSFYNLTFCIPTPILEFEMAMWSTLLRGSTHEFSWAKCFGSNQLWMAVKIEMRTINFKSVCILSSKRWEVTWSNLTYSLKYLYLVLSNRSSWSF